MECAACSRLHAPDAVRCVCGGTVAEGHAPHLLRGVFRFDRRIGAGSMGVVYHAVDLTLRREVAAKTLPRVTAEHVERLQREAQAMASIVHPNLAVIYGIETWRGIPFLIEEYLSGGTLADRLRAGPMSVDATLDMGMTLAEVLGQLHESGLVHCDIKPSNIGLSQSGVLKLLDFGLVHLLRESSDVVALTLGASDVRDTTSMIMTSRGLVGTPAYMSPEAINAESPAPAFDLWALAVVLYEALAGTRPFEGRDAHAVFASIVTGEFPDLRTLRGDCPYDVAQFFGRALAPDLASRPRDARALGAALSALRQSRA
jgi:serine/threonine protein kinase